MNTRLVSPASSALETNDATAPSLRPENLAQFVGQSQLKTNLSIFIEAAKGRQESLDHVLLHGPPGLGKTTLAKIIANELKVGFRATAGPIISKPGDLAAILTNLSPYDILFIDEIHRLNPTIEEILYPAMEDGKLDIMIGEGPGARSIQIALKPFTLIGATTRSGLITRPLRERFGIPLAFEFYTVEELTQMMRAYAKKFQMSLSPEGSEEIARRARGTPRIALRLLRRIRDIAHVQKAATITQKLADSALCQLDVDKFGLDAMDRKYLTAIGQTYEGGPVGVDTLAAVLAEQKDVVEEVVEPYLIQQGYIQRTPRGRTITTKTYAYLNLSPPQAPASLFTENLSQNTRGSDGE